MHCSVRTWGGMLAVYLVAYLLGLYRLLPPFIGAHASNFALTGAVFLGVAYRPLCRSGTTWPRLALLMVPFALVNVVVELFLSSDVLSVGSLDVGAFNTTDPVDLVAGLVALALIAATVWIANRPPAIDIEEQPG